MRIALLTLLLVPLAVRAETPAAAPADAAAEATDADKDIGIARTKLSPDQLLDYLKQREVSREAVAKAKEHTREIRANRPAAVVVPSMVFLFIGIIVIGGQLAGVKKERQR